MSLFRSSKLRPVILATRRITLSLSAPGIPAKTLLNPSASNRPVTMAFSSCTNAFCTRSISCGVVASASRSARKRTISFAAGIPPLMPALINPRNVVAAFSMLMPVLLLMSSSSLNAFLPALADFKNLAIPNSSASAMMAVLPSAILNRKTPRITPVTAALTAPKTATTPCMAIAFLTRDPMLPVTSLDRALMSSRPMEASPIVPLSFKNLPVFASMSLPALLNL